MKREIEEKTERLVRLLSEEGLGGVLINSQPNFAWLTAGGTNGVDSSRENGVATLLIRNDGRRFVMASKIEMQRMLVEELNGQGYEAVEFPWEDEKADPSLAAELAQSLVSKNLPLGADFAIGKGVQLIDAEVTRLRYRLTTAEVERLKVLGKDSGEAIGRMARALVPGLTESEVARRANDALAEIGARAVVNLVAADERIAKYRHPVPKDHAWRNVLMVVVCARRAGLIVSLTRLVCAGKSSEDLSRRTQASASVNAQLFAATRLGVAGSELYEVAARAYREAGFAGEEKLHHQGGATGYRTRDWVAHPHCGERVLERQAFAWNPSVTGAKVEETCIAFADGVEVVTTTPGWPMIAVEAGGREYRLPGVFEL